MDSDFQTSENINPEQSVGRVDYVLRNCDASGEIQLDDIPIGCATADAVLRDTTASAVILNHGDFCGNLQPGDATYADILAVLTENRNIAVAEVTSSELFDIFESAFAVLLIDEDGYLNLQASDNGSFPQVSGIIVHCDPSAPVGSRVSGIEYGDTLLTRGDTETVISIAATQFMFDGGYGYPAIEEYELTELSLGIALSGSVGKVQFDSYSECDRVVIPASFYHYSSNMGISLCVFALIVAILLVGPFRRLNKYFDRHRK